MDRLVVAYTALLNSTLLFRSMDGYDALSTLFNYSVELVSTDGDIDTKSLLGSSLSLQVKQLNTPDRWFNGDITGIVLKGKESGSSRYYVYQFDVRPKLWYLSENQDYRIFQQKTVPDIIMEILAKYSLTIEKRLLEDYRQWGYCVQYNESDFDFISRLMEHEGIYYYFEHKQGLHTLVLVDDMTNHHPLSDYPILPFRGPGAAAIADEACVEQWVVSDAVTTKFVSMTDYDFRKPYANLLEVKENRASYATERTEVYEWPGRYIDKAHADFYVKVRQQEREAQHEKMSALATTCSILPGYTFMLIKAPRLTDNREFLIIQTHYSIWDNTYASGSDASRGQSCHFTVIPSTAIWRTPRSTPWPKTNGPQTAIVTCPPGENIWTDKYGRVKVKFHWDRYAKGDDTSSCWLRVASAWAGQGFGGVQIPRLNDEVVVDFINGDPDRPLITGRLYNDANMPPWDLPGNATQMGFISRSKQGNKTNANVLRFEDSDGKEELFMQAEKDMNTLVKDNQTLTVNKGDRTLTIKTGNEKKTIEQGKLEETICLMRSTDANQVQVKATAGKGGPGTQYYEATDQIKLVVDGSVIEMTPDSITLSKGASSIVITKDDISLVGNVIHLNKDKG